MNTEDFLIHVVTTGVNDPDRVINHESWCSCAVGDYLAGEGLYPEGYRERVLYNDCPTLDEWNKLEQEYTEEYLASVKQYPKGNNYVSSLWQEMAKHNGKPTYGALYKHMVDVGFIDVLVD